MTYKDELTNKHSNIINNDFFTIFYKDCKVDEYVSVIAVSKKNDSAYSYVFDYEQMNDTIKDIIEHDNMFGNEVETDDINREEAIELLTIFSISMPLVIRAKWA